MQLVGGRHAVRRLSEGEWDARPPRLLAQQRGREDLVKAELLDQTDMNFQDVAILPACEECGELWLPGDAERWRADFIDDGPEDVLKFWCPGCWEREFS